MCSLGPVNWGPGEPCDVGRAHRIGVVSGWMGRSALGRDRRADDTLLMATHGTVQDIIDLTDEAAILTEERVVHDPRGVRALLSALNLKPVSGPMVDAPKGNVFDLAVYRATGDRRLATLFGTAA